MNAHIHGVSVREFKEYVQVRAPCGSHSGSHCVRTVWAARTKTRMMRLMFNAMIVAFHAMIRGIPCHGLWITKQPAPLAPVPLLGSPCALLCRCLVNYQW